MNKIHFIYIKLVYISIRSDLFGEKRKRIFVDDFTVMNTISPGATWLTYKAKVINMIESAPCYTCI